MGDCRGSGGKGGWQSKAQPIGGADILEEIENAGEFFGVRDGATSRWIDGLSQEQRDAIVGYTGVDYGDINGMLRGTAEWMDEDTFALYEPRVREITRALRKGVIPEPVELFRSGSSSFLGGADTVEKINALAGNIIYEAGFLSTTTSYSKAVRTRLGYGKGRKIVYHIKTPSGKGIGAYVSSMSSHKDESEVLFQRQTGLKVIRGYEAGGVLHCEVEYAGNMLS